MFWNNPELFARFPDPRGDASLDPWSDVGSHEIDRNAETLYIVDQFCIIK